MIAYCEQYEHVHNFCHFFMDMAFPLYYAMEQTNSLGKDLSVVLKKRPPDHNPMFPEVYDLFCKKGVHPIKDAPQVTPGTFKLVDKETLEVPFFKPLDSKDSDFCTCSKQDCKQWHYIRVSNKRFFPYVTPFGEFILKGLQIEQTHAKQITLVKRKGPRKILNINKLANELNKITKTEIVSLENMTLREQLNLMQKTKVLIGAHGAAMSHAFFLPKGSATLEIIPYGFNYDRFQKIGIARGEVYRQWRNPDASKTIPNWPKSFINGVDISVMPCDNPEVMQSGPKEGKAKADASKLRGWFRDQHTMVDVQKITHMADALLKL